MAAFGEIEGVQFPPDSGAGLPGAYWYPASAEPDTMTRSMSRRGHFDRINRDNYHALTEQKVLNVLFDGDTAIGVRYVAANAKSDADARTVKAKKEVIIAAGTYHTPQVLQGSGLGAKALLEEAGIEVKADLPGVGWNLQDHPLGGGASFNCESETDSHVWKSGFNRANPVKNFTIDPDPTDLTGNSTFRDAANLEFTANRSGMSWHACRRLRLVSLS
jgi:choline dehydrogenase-like flavoprotein